MATTYRSEVNRYGVRVNRVVYGDVEVTLCDLFGHDLDMRDRPRYMAWYTLDRGDYSVASRVADGDDAREVCDALADISLWNEDCVHPRVVLALESMAHYVETPSHQMAARR